jgi:microcystin-dependent protein
MAILNDIASALTGSVASDGQTPITGQLRGLVSANPAYSFNGDINTGFGSDVADEVYLQAGNVKALRATTSGATVTGNINAVGGLVLNNGNALVPTGVCFDYVGLVAPGGYVLGSGRSIGNASSNATERANADTQALFELIWNSANIANGEGQVQDSAGSNVARGANAPADFAANRRILLADFRGRVAAGKDDMGGTSANRLTAAGSGLDGDIQGNTGGAETVTLATANLPAYTPAGTIGSHTLTMPTRSITTATGSVPTITNAANQTTGNQEIISSFGGSATSTFTGTPQGGTATPANNVQPTIIKTKIIKL